MSTRALQDNAHERAHHSFPRRYVQHETPAAVLNLEGPRGGDDQKRREAGGYSCQQGMGRTCRERVTTLRSSAQLHITVNSEVQQFATQATRSNHRFFAREWMAIRRLVWCSGFRTSRCERKQRRRTWLRERGNVLVRSTTGTLDVGLEQA